MNSDGRVTYSGRVGFSGGILGWMRLLAVVMVAVVAARMSRARRWNVTRSSTVGGSNLFCRRDVALLKGSALCT
jgi:hypothetical protein